MPKNKTPFVLSAASFGTMASWNPMPVMIPDLGASDESSASDQTGKRDAFERGAMPSGDDLEKSAEKKRERTAFFAADQWLAIKQAEVAGLGAVVGLVLAGNTPLGHGAAVVLGGVALGSVLRGMTSWTIEKLSGVEHHDETPHASARKMKP